MAGTPEQVADTMEDWVDSRAADGFNLMPPLLPVMLDVFVDEVVPICSAEAGLETSFKARCCATTMVSRGQMCDDVVQDTCGLCSAAMHRRIIIEGMSIAASVLTFDTRNGIALLKGD